MKYNANLRKKCVFRKKDMNTECPHCKNDNTKKNGYTQYGKQNYRCKDCGRQYVINGQDWFIYTINAYQRENQKLKREGNLSLYSSFPNTT